MSHACRLTIALALGIAGCSTNAPYEPADRGFDASTATTRPAATPADATPVDPFANATPASAAAIEPAATQPSAAPRTHVVAKDETFYSLSKKYYGSGARWQAIRDANPGVTPERLPIGKTIVIP